MIYLCNTFTVHMLPLMAANESYPLTVTRIPAKEVMQILRENAFRSYFGHEESARHLAKYLGVTIRISRGNITLTENDVLIVAAITGKRKWEAGLKPCPGWIFFMVELRQ